jgi:hypothetical protein
MNKGEVNTIQPRSYLFGYRIALAILGVGTLLLSHYLNITNPLNTSFPLLMRNLRIYRYFTMQTNLLVVIWLILAIIWSSNPNRMKKLMGKLKGAITLYITVTFLVFAVVLSPLYHPSGIEGVLNLMLHYFIPVGFIIDWFISEGDNYQWSFIPYWFCYPIVYLIFALIHGGTTGDYLYPFLNLEVWGFDGLIIRVILLIALFSVLSSVYIFGSRRFLPVIPKKG